MNHIIVMLLCVFATRGYNPKLKLYHGEFSLAIQLATYVHKPERT